MAKARNFVEKARQRGVKEGEARAAEAVKRVTERPAPTIIHTEPKVDTTALAKEMGALTPLLAAIAEKESAGQDISPVVEAITKAGIDGDGLIKAISAVPVVLSEQLDAFVVFCEGQDAVVAAINELIDEQRRGNDIGQQMAEAMLALTDAYRAERTLTFTDGGAKLEAK